MCEFHRGWRLWVMEWTRCLSDLQSLRGKKRASGLTIASQWHNNYIFCVNRHIPTHIAGKNKQFYKFPRHNTIEHVTHNPYFMWPLFFESFFIIICFNFVQVDATCSPAKLWTCVGLSVSDWIHLKNNAWCCWDI